MPETCAKIGLLNHVWGGNLGDEATLDALIQTIRCRWPGAALYGLSMNPQDTRERHGIESYPIRSDLWGISAPGTVPQPSLKIRLKNTLGNFNLLLKLVQGINALAIRFPSRLFREIHFLVKSFRVVRPMDLLIISGGGQLLESSSRPWTFVGGPWKFPYTLFKWTLMARLVGARCLVLNVGAGPLVRPLSKFFVKGTLSLAEYVSFRDEKSQELARRIGFKGQSYVYPDTAYSLDIRIPPGRLSKGDPRPVVGLAPMAYGGPRLSPEHDPTTYNRLIQRLAAFGSWFLQNGYSLTLFCTDIGIDPPAVDDLERILGEMDARKIGVAGYLRRVNHGSQEELLKNMATMDYVVVCRFHAVVFAHMMNIPVLAISHHAKVATLMNDLGLSECCLDIENCHLKALTDAFATLVTNRDGIKSRMAEKLASYKARLTTQFDLLFPPNPAGLIKGASRGQE